MSRPRWAGAWTRALALVLFLGGCATAGGPSAPAPPEAPLAPAEVSAARALLLAPGRLPELAPTFRSLTVDDLGAEADRTDVVPTLDHAGYRGGLERTFHGRSRILKGAESRVLVFASEGGAARYTAYLADHAGAFLGEPTLVRPFPVDGRGGWLFRPPLCACPGAEPIYAGVVQDGERLLWLQITGREADPLLLRTLLRVSLGGDG